MKLPRRTLVLMVVVAALGLATVIRFVIMEGHRPAAATAPAKPPRIAAPAETSLRAAKSAPGAVEHPEPKLP